jgi:hypothetical protein
MSLKACDTERALTAWIAGHDFTMSLLTSWRRPRFEKIQVMTLCENVNQLRAASDKFPFGVEPVFFECVAWKHLFEILGAHCLARTLEVRVKARLVSSRQSAGQKK